MIQFSTDQLKELWQPKVDSYGEDNGQVTIIGGSRLFHGAPILALRAASRLADMVFFASPEPTSGEVAAKIKSKLSSFIWVPWGGVEEYIKKSDAVLIGPGLMRFKREDSRFKIQDLRKSLDEAGTLTRSITKYLLQKFPEKQWVIDGGSLQVMEAEWIPKNAILTPNRKEYESLFKFQFSISNFQTFAQKYKCVIVYKNPVSYVTDGEMTYEITGGNAGLTKGGTGDVLAGVTAGLAAKNVRMLAAGAAIWLVKKTADMLFEKVGYAYNADMLAEEIFETYRQFVVD